MELFNSPPLFSFLIFCSLAVLLVVVAAIFISLYRAQKSAAPFYPTSKRKLRAAFREAGLKPGEVFYDLGAGTGRALIIAEKEFGARAAGFEMSLLPYVLGKINLLVHSARADLRLADLFTADLREADVVFCFLVPHGIAKLEQKFKEELKPGARIISYAFPIPFLESPKVISFPRGWKMFVY